MKKLCLTLSLFFMLGLKCLYPRSSLLEKDKDEGIHYQTILVK